MGCVREKRVAALAAASVVVGVLAGCSTEIKVLKLPADEVVRGIPYALPQKVFLVSSEYELKDCRVAKVAGKSELQLEVAKTISVTPSIEVDPNERYYLPYSSIDSLFKETDITVESYDNQTLKSLSATIDDKTGEAITATIGTAIRIAAIAAGVSGPLLARSAAEQHAALCEAKAVEALAEIKALEKAKQGAAAAAARAASAPDVARIDAAIARLRQGLVYKELKRWVPRKGDPGSLKVDLYPGDFVSRHTWITAEGMKQLEGRPETDPEGRIVDLKTELLMTPRLPLTSEQLGASPLPGFVVRNPTMVLLRVCNDACAEREDGDVGKVLSATEYAVPQLGQYVVIPLKSRVFQNQTIGLTITAEGAIAKIGWKGNASGTAALEAVNTNLDAITKAKAAYEKAKADARTAAAAKDRDHANEVKENNNAVAECLRAQSAVKEAGGAPTGSCQ